VIWIGTSGWQYRDWRGPFYPADLPQRAWLSAYAERFPTVELNNSFYRLPTADAFERWRAATPHGFVFAVKASRFLTHLRRLRDPEDPVRLLWSRMEPLRDKLGPVLFQLPPRFPADVERLRGLLGVLPREAKPAIEFRDPSWYRPEIYRVLERSNAALVWPDRPGSKTEPPLTADWAYIRFHQGRQTSAAYDARKLRRWAERILDLPTRECWIYFNNDPGAAAPRDAAKLREFLAMASADLRLATGAA
jgi:uncharacterized protein YecE (DUF72 family)